MCIRDSLVFSATEPYRRVGDDASWWQQLEPLAQRWVVSEGGPFVADDAAEPVEIDALPDWHAAAAPPAAPADDSPAARLGRAVHRALEWATGGADDLGPLAEAAAGEFGADEREVGRLAGRILASPACARFFDRRALRWAGNEVPIVGAGAPLRIDRLVQLDEDGASVWWVLDYKLRQRPQELAAYREQLASYRDAVRAAQPGSRVRAAFIAGDGSLVELA